jgi:hypothetical protein
MAREVTRQEFLRTAGRLAAAAAAGGALASIGDATAAAAAGRRDDDDEPASPFSPRPGARRVCVDTPLSIIFDQPPAIGAAGLITVIGSDGVVVDTIDLAAAVQTRKVGLNPTPLKYHPVIVSGNRASIYLHAQLAHGQTYHVLVDAGVFTTASRPAPLAG